MTKLKLITSDQHLIAAQKVKIASGDINSVQLKVTFDSAWDNYPTRTAVFHTSTDATKHESLLIDNACVIPSEVLAEPGILHIGVRGLSMDGTKVKTSSKVQHKIVQGAETGETTISPALDLYMQYIAAMDARVDPIFTEIKARLAEQHAAQMAELTDLLTPVVLWTNPDDTVEFEEQKIELDLTEYKRITILCKIDKSSYSSYFEISYGKKNITYVAHTPKFISVDAPQLEARTVYIDDTGVAFGKAKIRDGYDNEYIIPVEIIGYKY